jgi:hypothetical protein
MTTTLQSQAQLYFQEACELCKQAMIVYTECISDIFRLHAGLSVLLSPPNYDATIESYSEFIRRNPKDFDAVS